MRFTSVSKPRPVSAIAAGALIGTLFLTGCTSFAQKTETEASLFTSEDRAFFQKAGRRPGETASDKENKTDVASLLAMARFYSEANRADLAERLYQKAVDANPSDSVAYVGLTKHYFNNGKFDAAATLLESGLQATKQAAPLLNELAVLRAKQGDIGAAVEAAGKAYERAPTVSLYRENYGNLLASTQQYERAFEVFSSVDGPVEARFRIARSAAGLGRRDIAERQLQIVLRSEPQHEGASKLYAQLNGESPNWAAAAALAKPTLPGSSHRVETASAVEPRDRTSEASWKSRGVIRADHQELESPPPSLRPSKKQARRSVERAVAVVEDEPE